MAASISRIDFFVVAVSKNIDINNFPDNLQISLTRMQKPVGFYLLLGQPIPEVLPIVTRVGYLLHKPLRGYRSELKAQETTNDVSDELKSVVINLTNTYPELQLKDDMGIIEYNKDNLLARLVQSDFDLSILP